MDVERGSPCPDNRSCGGSASWSVVRSLRSVVAANRALLLLMLLLLASGGGGGTSEVSVLVSAASLRF